MVWNWWGEKLKISEVRIAVATRGCCSNCLLFINNSSCHIPHNFPPPRPSIFTPPSPFLFKCCLLYIFFTLPQDFLRDSLKWWWNPTLIDVHGSGLGVSLRDDSESWAHRLSSSCFHGRNLLLSSLYKPPLPFLHSFKRQAAPRTLPSLVGMMMPSLVVHPQWYWLCSPWWFFIQTRIW